MVVEEIHVEDKLEIVSLVLSLIISWTFRILAHEEDRYTDFLSIALKQTKAGPRCSKTPFLVLYYFLFILSIFILYIHGKCHNNWLRID